MIDLPATELDMSVPHHPVIGTVVVVVEEIGTALSVGKGMLIPDIVAAADVPVTVRAQLPAEFDGILRLQPADVVALLRQVADQYEAQTASKEN